MRSTADSSPDGLAARLRGRYVTYTGRLAWVSHDQFDDIVTSVGGRYTFNLGAGVAVLVVGERQPPVEQDGTLSPHLRLARVMERGRTLGAQIIGERDFLDQVTGRGTGGDDGGPRLFTTATLTDMLEIPASRIRAWVQAGLVRPAKTEHGVWHFDFRQVSAAKTLDHLVRSGVPAGRIRRSLSRLRAWLPEAQHSLDQLALLERDGELLVRLERGDLAAADGQLQLDFDADADADAEPPAPLRMFAGPKTAAEWFEQGVEQEQAGYLDDAAESYRQSLLAGGPDARTAFELGNVLSALGRKKEAVERYLQAVEIDKDFGDAWNNLGITLCAISRKEAGCAAFRRALAADPADARARYNLADTLDELRRFHEAAEHWRAYLRLDADSEWGAHASDRLAATS